MSDHHRGAPPLRRAAVFLDRDGVLDELVPEAGSGVGESPLHPDDVRLLPGAADAVVRLNRLGYLLVCVSNQPAAAKGTLPMGDLLATHERVIALLGEAGARFDAVRLCVHHPDGIVPELSGPCACRKPAPGMLLDVARALDIDLSGSWMIGDTDADVLAGQGAGCRTILVQNERSAHKRLGKVFPDFVASDLQGAVTRIPDLHDRAQARDEPTERRNPSVSSNASGLPIS